MIFLSLPTVVFSRYTINIKPWCTICNLHGFEFANNLHLNGKMSRNVDGGSVLLYKVSDGVWLTFPVTWSLKKQGWFSHTPTVIYLHTIASFNTLPVAVGLERVFFLYQPTDEQRGQLLVLLLLRDDWFGGHRKHVIKYNKKWNQFVQKVCMHGGHIVAAFRWSVSENERIVECNYLY